MHPNELEERLIKLIEQGCQEIYPEANTGALIVLGEVMAKRAAAHFKQQFVVLKSRHSA